MTTQLRSRSRGSGQDADEGGARQLDRQRARVLRLLHLRHRGRAGLRQGVLPRVGPRDRDAALARHLRGRLRGAPDRRLLHGPHRRQVRPQARPAAHRVADGRRRRSSSAACRPTTRSASGRRCCSSRCGCCRASRPPASRPARTRSRSSTRPSTGARSSRASRSAARRPGLIIATAVFLPIGALPEEQLLSWGWRIPFWLSAVVVVVGLLIRRRLEEPPAFREEAARHADDGVPDGRAVPRPLGRRAARRARRDRLDGQHDLRASTRSTSRSRPGARPDDDAVGRDRHERRRARRDPAVGDARRPDRPQAGVHLRRGRQRRADVRLPRGDRQRRLPADLPRRDPACPASSTAP